VLLQLGVGYASREATRHVSQAIEGDAAEKKIGPQEPLNLSEIVVIVCSSTSAG
jgi:hypothetical protein